MPCLSRIALVSLVVVACAWSSTAPAIANAPQHALIELGRSMDGAVVASPIGLPNGSGQYTSGPLASWGTMIGSFCFEGTNCVWNVVGGGRAEVIRAHGRINRIDTNAPGWRTAKGIGHGSSVSSLKQAYPHRLAHRATCGLNGFGGNQVGYVLNSRHNGERRFTFFALSASRQRVSTVWVGRGRVVARTGC